MLKNFSILLVEIVILALFAGAAYKMYAFSLSLEEEHRDKVNTILISDELKQSSDDLTHYLTTKNIEEINKNIFIAITFMIFAVILLVVINIYFYYFLKIEDKKTSVLNKKREQRFGELIESTDNWVWEIDTQGKYTYSSHQVKKLLGYTVEEVVGKTIFDFISKKDMDKVKKKFNESMQNHQELIGFENINTHKDGHEVHLLSSATPFFDDDGKILGYRGMDSDITLRKELEYERENYSKHLEKEIKVRTKELEYQAQHDALTGLPNRVLFNDRLLKAIDSAKRDNTKIALLFIDLDNFKGINDSLGHASGDEILKIATSRLQEAIREEDTVARLGGDEFIIILKNLTKVQDASLIAQKILNTVYESMNIHDNELYISTSIGISIYPNDGNSYEDLLKFADVAMYKAKDEGRNNYQYYNQQMTELAFERVIMETSLRIALANEQFIVYYQPQVNGVTNELIGLEALVRWQHPTMGIISPGKFIPLAESTGLIVEIDRYVMKTAMKQMAKWYKDGLNPGKLSMNLAVKQLQKNDFIEIFVIFMKETNCKAEWLELEVTESQIMTKPEEAVKILKQISDLGIELAVDDFGTGYSSLAYLKRLPIDKLKIDQVFVKDLPYDEEDVGITKAVIALAKSLNLNIIAEGVETKKQVDFLVENGCSNLQGYYYSKAIPANEVELLLKNGITL